MQLESPVAVHRPVTVTPTQPLAWKLPYAVSVALKSKKKIFFYKTEDSQKNTEQF